MEPKFQTAFIPKRPISVQTGIPSSSSAVPTGNIFSLIATIMFILTLIYTLGIFGYRFFLQKQIENAGIQIDSARDAFDPKTTLDLVNKNDRMASVRGILENHVAISGFFSALQRATLKRVRFTSFLYNNKNGELNVSIEGEAQSYNSLAQQADVFSKSNFIKNVEFLDINLSENGNIKFKVNAVVDQSVISYKNSVEPNTSNQ